MYKFEIFLTYSHGNQVGLSIELENISKKIVKACNGLPLSVKVVESFLRGQKRLRCWEQALQRLKTARYLDGDEENSDLQIWKILEVSFSNLHPQEKDMFFDISFFFFLLMTYFHLKMLKERTLQN